MGKDLPFHYNIRETNRHRLDIFDKIDRLSPCEDNRWYSSPASSDWCRTLDESSRIQSDVSSSTR